MYVAHVMGIRVTYWKLSKLFRVLRNKSEYYHNQYISTGFIISLFSITRLKPRVFGSGHL